MFRRLVFEDSAALFTIVAFLTASSIYVPIRLWVRYWGYYAWLRAGPNSAQAVVAAMAKIESARLVAAKVDDATLWKMSQNAAFVDAGRATFVANCSACHLASLRGK